MNTDRGGARRIPGRWLARIALVGLIMASTALLGGAPSAVAAPSTSDGVCIEALRTAYRDGKVIAQLPQGRWIVVGAGATICGWMLGASAGDKLAEGICWASRQPWGGGARGFVSVATSGRYQVC